MLQFVAIGQANKEVARELGMSEDTVKAHLKSILSKLDVSERTRDVTLAIKRGIIQLWHHFRAEALQPRAVGPQSAALISTRLSSAEPPVQVSTHGFSRETFSHAKSRLLGLEECEWKLAQSPKVILSVS